MTIMTDEMAARDIQHSCWNEAKDYIEALQLTLKEGEFFQADGIGFTLHIQPKLDPECPEEESVAVIRLSQPVSAEEGSCSENHLDSK